MEIMLSSICCFKCMQWWWWWWRVALGQGGGGVVPVQSQDPRDQFKSLSCVAGTQALEPSLLHPNAPEQEAGLEAGVRPELATVIRDVSIPKQHLND